MAGPAAVQASSAAFATIPNAYGTAFQSGWILDQRLDTNSTGGFLTNCSQSSSGYIITSSGDGTTGASGTGFYVIGRRVKIIQGGTTVYGSVNSASVSAGLTTVGLSSAGATAALSTGTSLTSVSVGLSYPDSQAHISAQAALSADVTMTNAATTYDGPSVSLGAGTWLVNAHVAYITATALGRGGFRISDGTTAGTYATAEEFGESAGVPYNVKMTAIITLATTTTIKLQGASAVALNTISATAGAAVGGLFSGLTGTKITAVRIS